MKGAIVIIQHKENLINFLHEGRNISIEWLKWDVNDLEVILGTIENWCRDNYYGGGENEFMEWRLWGGDIMIYDEAMNLWGVNGQLLGYGVIVDSRGSCAWFIISWRLTGVLVGVGKIDRINILSLFCWQHYACQHLCPDYTNVLVGECQMPILISGAMVPMG